MLFSDDLSRDVLAHQYSRIIDCLTFNMAYQTTHYRYPLEAFAGDWRMVSQENLDGILRALGIFIWIFTLQYLI